MLVENPLDLIGCPILVKAFKMLIVESIATEPISHTFRKQRRLGDQNLNVYHLANFQR
jgi:hypothetical protein